MQNIRTDDDFGIALRNGKQNLLPLSKFVSAKGLPEDLRKTLQKDLDDFVAEIKKSLKDNVSKTSNGREKMLVMLNTFGLPEIKQEEPIQKKASNKNESNTIPPTGRKIIYSTDRKKNYFLSMANKAEFKTSLLRMFRARIPFISIRSIERTRVLEVVQQLAEEINIPIYVHSLSHGMIDIKTKKGVNDDRSVAGGIDFAVQNISQRQNLTFVFTEVSDIEDDNVVSRHIYDCVVQAIERGGSICVISTKSVWSQLQRLGMTLTLDAPNEEEMLDVVKECVTPYKGSIPIEWEESDYKMAATILANMTKIEAENVLATQMAKGSLTKDDIKELSQAKDKLY